MKQLLYILTITPFFCFGQNTGTVYKTGATNQSTIQKGGTGGDSLNVVPYMDKTRANAYLSTGEVTARKAGRLVVDTTDKELYYHNNTELVQLARKAYVDAQIAAIPTADVSGIRDTTEALYDTASAIRNSFRTNATVGTLYDKKSWGSLADFTSGITPTLVDSNIKVAYTSSAAQNPFSINSYTQLDRWSVTANIVIDTSAFTKVGIGHYGAGQFSSSGVFIDYRKATGKVYVMVGNGTTMDSSYYSVPAIAGDTLVFNAKYDYDNIHVRGSVYNLRSDSSAMVDYSAGEAEERGALNNVLSASIGRYSLITYNGGFTIDSLNVTSRTIKNPDLAIAGHSIGWGATVTDNHYSFPFIIGRYFDNMVQMSGSGNSINDLINLLPQSAMVAPKQVLGVIGYNDFFFGVSIDSIIARYDRLVAGYEALGTRYIHTTPTYSTALDVSPLRTHILSTYDEADIIDLYPVIQSMGSAGLYDGVHPNDSGSARIAHAILCSGKIHGQMVNNVPIKDHATEDNIIQYRINRPTTITGLPVPSGDQTVQTLYNPNAGTGNGVAVEYKIGNNNSARGKLRISDNAPVGYRFMSIDLFGTSALQEVARFSSYHRGLLLGGIDTNQAFVITRPVLMAAGPIGTWSAPSNDVSGVSRYWGVAADQDVRDHMETYRNSGTASNNHILRRVHNGSGGFGLTKGFTMRGDERYGFGVDSTDVTATVDIGGNLRVRTIPAVTTYDSVLVVNEGVLNAVLFKISSTATLDFPSTAANEFSDLTITATGAEVGNPVLRSVPTGSTTQGSYSAWVSATNTVTVRFHNTGAGAYDPASGSFTVYVFK